MSLVLALDEIDATYAGVAGGKAANLGELVRSGVRVPDGCCVTTEAYETALAGVPSFEEHLERLSRLPPDDRTAVGQVSAQLRAAIESAAVPPAVAVALDAHLSRLGAQGRYAVRSSATAEDLPGASFAGQHDTYLEVPAAAVLAHVQRCWASLFTDRAVAYRLRNGFDHRAVLMAVVVQQMVVPVSSGVLFTADPVTGNRRTTTVEAVRGLGEALVSGLVTPEHVQVRDGIVTGSTTTLTDAQVGRLADLGRRIETFFGSPQDIEWCLAGDEFFVVQSRPITTLFPVPAAPDASDRVYLSVGHQQMMTDAMTPLGLSFWQQTTPQPMAEAGSRLFVDVTARLAAPTSRVALLDLLGNADPRIRDALQTVLDRGFAAPTPDPPARPAGEAAAPVPTDPAIVAELIERTDASVARLRREIAEVSGPAVFGLIRSDVAELTKILFDPRGLQVITAGFEATEWLNRRLAEWLGEPNAADTLTQSVPHNVTSEMGLALLDVADAVRPHADVVAALQRAGTDFGLDDLAGLAGGAEARVAIAAFLDRYGMRCAGEIDITRPRWSEQPGTLVPTVLANVRNFTEGAAVRRFEQGRLEAARREQDLLTQLRALPDGAAKAADTARTIERLRTFVGFREYPKYGMICRYFAYKQAMLREADRLVDAGVLATRDDCFFLRFEELHEAVRTHRVDLELVRRRRETFASHRTLTPPRVLTSDGEGSNGRYRRDDLPADALVGLPVSAGTVEGRARVVTDIGQADLEPGDILVTTFTDPSWTPLFVGVAGLVTEVGGVMTHGAVIAREYGLPAVVGVDGATRLIADGQRIRVHGTDGYVEVLPRRPPGASAGLPSSSARARMPPCDC